jgi:hypothetical protein
MHTRSDKNDLYIMTSSLCKTRRDKTFFPHDSMRLILDMSTQSVHRRCAKHIA